MLGKLIKYEIKATSRIFLPLYLVLILFAVINYFMALGSGNFTLPKFITLTLYILILVGMFVVSFVVMLQRFYKNLLSEEGYLMFTLPVQPWKHIICKLIVSSIWTILSVIIAVISILIIALQEVALTDIFNEISKIWSMMYQALGNKIYLYVIQFVTGAIVSLATSTLIIYAAMAIGHLSNNHKILASIGSYLGLYTLSQIVASIIFLLPLFQSQNTHYNINDMNLQLTGNQYANLYINIMGFRQMLPRFMWGAIALSAVLGAAYFIITDQILNKRLNLE
ncbi:MAG: hypothetical protein ACOX4T_08015 [Acetivibrionales bacterium]|jgi:hypothetical protein